MAGSERDTHVAVRFLLSAGLIFAIDSAEAQPKPVPQPAQAKPTTAAPVPAAQGPAVQSGKPGPAFNVADPNVRPPQSPDLFSGFLDPFDYDPRGRRDPFAQVIAGQPMVQGNNHGPLLPLQRYELNQLRLTGILWNVRQPKAILRDPAGNVHIAVPNAKIGSRNGYVAVIREGEIVVVETIEQGGRLVSTAQVVKIAK